MSGQETAADRYELGTSMTSDEALDAVKRASDLWGAEWARSGTAGEIHLPVNAGVRTGLLSGRIETAAGDEGAVLRFDVTESRYQTNKQAVALLVAGALSGVVLMLWPFFPILLGFAPVAIVMALICWFVVGSRLRNNGPREFLDFVVEQGEPAPEG